jgi:S-adenosylmethionine/arginine decarboxylase-like enzyme
MSTDATQQGKHWGKSAHINLGGCQHERLTSAPILEQFVKELVAQVGMKAHGPCYIDRFGSPDEGLEGYSAMQFIETSSITVHLDEVSDRAYVDLFTCKDFDADKAFEFVKNYFGAQEGTMTVLDR